MLKQKFSLVLLAKQSFLPRVTATSLKEIGTLEEWDTGPELHKMVSDKLDEGSLDMTHFPHSYTAAGGNIILSL